MILHSSSPLSATLRCAAKLRFHRLLLILLATVMSGLHRQTHAEEKALNIAADQARADIEEAASALVEQRAQIADEQAALLNTIEERRADLREVQAELEAFTQRQKQAEERRRELRARIAYLHELTAYLNDLAVEARQGFEARIAPAAVATVTERLAQVDQLLEDNHTDGLPAAISKLLELFEEDAASQLGGRKFPGPALKPDGEVVQGTFAQFGPVVYFAADDPDGPAGPVTQLSGSLLPTVFTRLESNEIDSVRALVTTGSELGGLPVDVTSGGALRLRESRETLWEHLRKGRVIMIPLLGLGLFCSVLAIFKAIQLSQVVTRKPEARIAEIVAQLRADRPDTAAQLAGKLPKPLGPVIMEGISHFNVSKEHLEEIMYERLILQAPELERFLAPLAVSASAAPLLGLLGTVTGMIHTFRLITIFGTGDASLLSAGISEALVTTEVGLIVAIPALLVHAFLSRRVRRAVSLTQQSAVMFVNGIKLRPNVVGNDLPRGNESPE